MKSAYFDCFSGISGDMTVAALIDAGADFDELKNDLKGLNIRGYEVSAEKVRKKGISATGFRVDVTEDQDHRNLQDINRIISESSLSSRVKNDALSIFHILAQAEAHVHGTDIDRVHFHEVGALDSIIDICAAAIAVSMLGIESFSNSSVNTGRGLVKTAHGLLPVPAPATAELLKGTVAYAGDIEAELTTPTGAAILSYYSTGTGPMPEMNISSIGYGAGSKELPIPNLLRIFTGTEYYRGDTADMVAEIETSIDDMNPEIFSYLFELLFAEGALDSVIIPAFAKKNRPASILKVLAPLNISDRIIDIIFRETTTSGVRVNHVMRRKLERRIIKVDTIYGSIGVKIHEKNGEMLTVSPEYNDCREAAIKNSVPLKKVYSEAGKEVLIKYQR